MLINKFNIQLSDNATEKLKMTYLEKLLNEAKQEHEAMWEVARKDPYRTVSTKKVRDIENPLRVLVVGIRAYELEQMEA